MLASRLSWLLWGMVCLGVGSAQGGAAFPSRVTSPPEPYQIFSGTRKPP